MAISNRVNHCLNIIIIASLAATADKYPLSVEIKRVPLTNETLFTI